MVNPERLVGVEFVRASDGSITARDLKTGQARGAPTRGKALEQLAEVLVLMEGGGEPIEDQEAFLREIGIDPDDIDGDKELPEFMR